MDGLKSNGDVIVIGATNLKSNDSLLMTGTSRIANYGFWFLDVLDPALLRSGRFDLVIDVPQPNKNGRKQILQHYLEKVKHNIAIDVERLASISGVLNGSDLQNIVNQAAIRAVQQGQEIVETR